MVFTDSAVKSVTDSAHCTIVSDGGRHEAVFADSAHGRRDTCGAPDASMALATLDFGRSVCKVKYKS